MLSAQICAVVFEMQPINYLPCQFRENRRVSIGEQDVHMSILDGSQEHSSRQTSYTKLQKRAKFTQYRWVRKYHGVTRKQNISNLFVRVTLEETQPAVLVLLELSPPESEEVEAYTERKEPRETLFWNSHNFQTSVLVGMALFLQSFTEHCN